MADRWRSVLACAAVATAAASAALGAAFAAGQRELRTGVVPWATAALVAGAALTVLAAAHHGPSVGRRSATVVAAASSVTATLFVAIGVAERLWSDGLDHLPLAGPVNLLASTATLLALPAGLLAYSATTLRRGQVLPALATAVVLAVPILNATMADPSTDVGFLALPPAAGLLWAAHGGMTWRQRA